jgi:hypothetical protein
MRRRWTGRTDPASPFVQFVLGRRRAVRIEGVLFQVPRPEGIAGSTGSKDHLVEEVLVEVREDWTEACEKE